MELRTILIDEKELHVHTDDLLNYLMIYSEDGSLTLEQVMIIREIYDNLNMAFDISGDIQGHYPFADCTDDFSIDEE